ncbi:hypothetical protein DLAC_00237 [Tieghemostelium lacteum]|uniref:Uncharacterized protein n=1 Tax=Tieghemostelium lacteum TaxID=361077 RepID=A0A152A982_TIELA|nr:hypothetical protein DLAC_00237 [Tieghemostelium lacteum]|eukprot:KYR02774.1 hypothetical protein DLAC_00237 [Tieghemostelium lacteum]
MTLFTKIYNIFIDKNTFKCLSKTYDNYINALIDIRLIFNNNLSEEVLIEIREGDEGRMRQSSIIFKETLLCGNGQEIVKTVPLTFSMRYDLIWVSVYKNDELLCNNYAHINLINGIPQLNDQKIPDSILKIAIEGVHTLKLSGNRVIGNFDVKIYSLLSLSVILQISIGKSLESFQILYEKLLDTYESKIYLPLDCLADDCNIIMVKVFSNNQMHYDYVYASLREDKIILEHEDTFYSTQIKRKWDRLCFIKR